MIEVGECVGDLDTLSDMVTGMVGHGGPTASLSRFLVLGSGSELFKFEVSNLAVTGGEVTCTAYHWGPLSTSEIGSSRGQRIGSESYREFATSRLGPGVSRFARCGSTAISLASA